MLSQRKPDDVIEIDMDLDELDITSAETKAIYGEIQQYVLKETGMIVFNLYIVQVKDKCGMEKRPNYKLPKTRIPDNRNARLKRKLLSWQHLNTLI